MGGKKIAGSRILPQKPLVESERREREVELMGRGGAASCLEELSQSQWQLVGRPIKTSNKQLHLHQCGISQMALQGI